jgi:hypothetical protein
MWAEGGPVITVQLDNESGDAAYLVALKAAALAAGIAPPFFVSTGLNKVPFGAMLPFTGMYPVAFWSGANNQTASPDYLFTPPDYAGSGYPTLWCELGAGIASIRDKVPDAFKGLGPIGDFVTGIDVGAMVTHVSAPPACRDRASRPARWPYQPPCPCPAPRPATGHASQSSPR